MGKSQAYLRMNEFLKKRELVSFSVTKGNHKIPRKEDFKVSVKNGATEKWTRLPNGEPLFLTLEGVGKFREKNGVLVSWTIEQEYKGGVPHGKYRVFQCREGRERKLVITGQFKKGKPSGLFEDFRDPWSLKRAVYVRGEIFEYFYHPSTIRFIRNKRGVEDFVFEVRSKRLLIKSKKETFKERKETRVRFFSKRDNTIDEDRGIKPYVSWKDSQNFFLLDNFFKVKLSSNS
ncbi:hypothetical protein MEL_123 [Melbournevirus]|uniref:hypothetical protein n=1 Tax=Melbournevirus TaxID=1560514 RepID=UPI00051F5D3D|nr:hypothetical protein MEL_123 [Melbournevirus]AIT54736.1 MORN repeat-containing protein [Melbournevirus]